MPGFEPEWPPTINGKKRRGRPPAGAAPPRVDHAHKRFNSDSELNGFDKLFGGDDVTTSAAGLVRPGDRCNSLPDIDNGGDELRHWLRKLDKLSSELQEFNNRVPASGNYTVTTELNILSRVNTSN